jgi:MoaA/NifB/PqqE/SkfB family radical SAM enzyme
MTHDQQVKLAMSPRFSAHLSGAFVRPINIELSVSGVCHEGCPYCFYRGRQSKTYMPLDLVEQFCRDCEQVKAITLTGGGEPTEHPELSRITACFRGRQLSLGLFTAYSHPERIIPEHYEWVRVSFTRRNSGRDYARLREVKTAGLCVNYAGVVDNALIDDAVSVVDKYGLDYVHVRPVMDRDGAVTTHEFLYDIKHPKLVVQHQKFDDQLVNARPYAQCEGYHFVPFVWEDGLVTVCAYFRTGFAVLGNLKDRGFADIMADAPVSVPVISKCQACCKNHEINKLIYAARCMKDADFV